MNEATHRHFALSRLLARDADASRLNIRDIEVLDAICAGHTTIQSLCAELNVHHSTVYRVSIKLASRGFVTRSLTRVEATAPGRAMIERINAYVASCLADRTAA